MKIKKKSILSILLSLALMFGLMSGMSLTTYATDGHTHNDVTFNEWTNAASLLTAGNYYLTSDVTLDSDWTLSGDSPVNINLCLNGHTINLNNHTIKIGSGYQLNIYDCSGTGKITGYNNSSNSGFAVHIQSGTFRMYGGSFTGNTACYVVYVDGGTFTMSGGSFTNNTTTWDCVRSRSTFTMSGGSFTNNSGSSVVTVYQGSTTMSGGSITNNTVTRGAVNVYSTFNISGNVTITGNKTSGNKNRNVMLGDSKTINVIDNLNSAARIGVTRDSSGVFTSGLSGKGSVTNFTSDNDAYTLSLTNDGEAQLSQLAPATVTKAPTAKTLTAKGSAQELVTAGEASNGTMQYALGKDKNTAPTEGWSESIPTGTDAETYYVWYKAKGADGYGDSEPACVTVTIDKSSATPEEQQSEEEEKNPDGTRTVTKTEKAKDGSTDITVTTYSKTDEVISVYVYKNQKSTNLDLKSVNSKTLKKVSIPATLKANGKTYKVTRIRKNFLKNCRQATKVDIGKNVNTIDKNAFNYGKKVNKIVIRGKLKKVGKGAVKATKKNVIIKMKVRRKTFKKNKALLEKSGLPKNAKIKKMKSTSK